MHFQKIGFFGPAHIVCSSIYPPQTLLVVPDCYAQGTSEKSQYMRKIYTNFQSPTSIVCKAHRTGRLPGQSVR